MEWQPEYSVGIETIDRQHQEILGYINQLTTALDSGDRWHVSHYLLIQITDFIKVHFAVEEALLEITRYPELEPHRASHREIVAHILSLQAKAVKEDISVELVQFLRDWFIGHVLKSDKQYGYFFAEQQKHLVPPPAPDVCAA